MNDLPSVKKKKKSPKSLRQQFRQTTKQIRSLQDAEEAWEERPEHQSKAVPHFRFT